MPQCTLTNATSAFAHLSMYFSPISWTCLYFEPLSPLVSSEFFTMNHGKKYICTCNLGCACVHAHTHSHTLSLKPVSQKNNYLYCYSDVFIMVYFI